MGLYKSPFFSGFWAYCKRVDKRQPPPFNAVLHDPPKRYFFLLSLYLLYLNYGIGGEYKKNPFRGIVQIR